MSKYSIKSNYNKSVISSNHAANYKQLIQFDKNPELEVNFFSMDTGMNENPLSGHYFDMNIDHYSGKLQKMKIGK